MKSVILSMDGNIEKEIELPRIFSLRINHKLIHKAFVNLNSHQFQKQGRHNSAGMDVSASTLNPPTGHGQSRIARIHSGGGGRQGQAGGVASVRGGRQAHPPKSEKIIYKKLNKKENKYALCLAMAATTSKQYVQNRGHKIDKIKYFPIIISDQIESLTKTSEIKSIITNLNLIDDINRLKSRKIRTGKPSYRGRKNKRGKSVLIVTKNPKNLFKACGALPGVDVRAVNHLSILDLAPGSQIGRLTMYSKNAIEEIAKIKLTKLSVLEKIS
ncbi:MAG: 50S ribosomal protein L4 [Nitrosopumilaceae archaeon]|nr:50S ribosomal protein L4 [Nitrosopumilaceae archaeon]